VRVNAPPIRLRQRFLLDIVSAVPHECPASTPDVVMLAFSTDRPRTLENGHAWDRPLRRLPLRLSLARQL